MKNLKGVILDWITPPDQGLKPPLTCNSKNGCGFHHPVTSALLCSVDLDWNEPEGVFICLILLLSAYRYPGSHLGFVRELYKL